MQVQPDLPLDAEGRVIFDQWLNVLERAYPGQKLTLVRETYHLVAAKLGQDTPIVQQGIHYAAILGQLMAGPEAMAVAIVYPSMVEGELPKKWLKENVPESIVKVLGEVKKLQSVELLYRDHAGQSPARAEAMRKVLLAMINDVQVVLIKLAEQLYRLRHSDALAQEQQILLAQDVNKLYIPLANRLGIGQLKWEMEDRTFRILNREAYSRIKQYLDEKRLDREQYMRTFVAELKAKLDELGVVAEVSGRVKHIYSIWRKMQKKQLQFDQLYDVRAVRILVKDVFTCYRVLSLIQDTWPPIQSEFSDYIASPKPNGYQSIHSVISGPEDKTIEVQIRTFSMHEESEMGVAAHWRYKEGGRRDVNIENRIKWLRDLLEWQADLGEEQGDGESVKQHVLDERIYVFTPNGDVIDLPKGATPLDFAYHIHTEVGHRFRGAKVDGNMVPIHYKLSTGQRVDILTRKESRPSRDWLNKEAHCLNTSRGRAKVQQWFKEQQRHERAQLGKQWVTKALLKEGLSITKVPWSEVLDKLDFRSQEELFAGLASGAVAMRNILSCIKPEQPEERNEEVLPQLQEGSSSEHSRSQNSLTIDGVDNLMFHLAGCCHPVFGEPVVGYITQGRGVSIHRLDCQAFAQLSAQRPERTVWVEWGEEKGVYPVSLQLRSHNKSETIKALTQLLVQLKLPLLSMNSPNQTKEKVSIQITIELKNLEELNGVMAKLKNLPYVDEVTRAG